MHRRPPLGAVEIASRKQLGIQTLISFASLGIEAIVPLQVLIVVSRTVVPAVMDCIAPMFAQAGPLHPLEDFPSGDHQLHTPQAHAGPHAECPSAAEQFSLLSIN